MEPNYEGTGPRDFWYGATTYLNPSRIGQPLERSHLPDFLQRLNVPLTLIGIDTYSVKVRLNDNTVGKCVIAGPHSGVKVEQLERKVGITR